MRDPPCPGGQVGLGVNPTLDDARSVTPRGCGRGPQPDRGYPLGVRQVLLYPGQDGFWVAECPSLPGCVSQGDTREAAVQNIREAIEGYVLALQDDGLPVPAEHFDALLLAV